MIYIASDHGGFKLKEQLKKFLANQKLAHTDLGPKKFEADDDYPDYAAKVAMKISRNPIRDCGILICRSGQGVCIVANKFANVRAGLVWNAKESEMSRIDDMTNVLCLPSDYITDKQAEQILSIWLNTSYSSEERHIRRIRKITDLENK